MARYNEILAGRLNRGLQKLLGMKGEPPSPQLASEISPSLVIFRGKEDRYLESWNLFALAQFQGAGGAGFSAQFKFRNPLNSGIVAVFEKVTLIGFNANDDLRVSINKSATPPVDYTTSVNGAILRFDARGLQNSSLVLTQQNNIAAPALQAIARYIMNLNAVSDLILADVQEFPLLPGDELTIWNNIANVSSGNHIWWRERRLEESELS